jgi:GT2 family glycosyltransferase
MEKLIIKNTLLSVRVVILNYNQAKYTIEAVNFIRNQDYKNIELVVVDNNSLKEDFLILQNLLPKSTRIVRSEQNLGYARGNNLGCKLSTKIIPDYYFIINNDVVINDDQLISKLVESLQRNEKNKIVAVSPLVNTVSTGKPLENQIQVRKLLPFYKQTIVNSPFLNKIFFWITNEYIYKDKMPYIGKETIVDSINGAVFLIYGPLFSEIGFFDEGTFLFFEEIILGKKIQQMGYYCLLNGYTMIDHLQGLSTKSDQKSFNLKMEREKIISENYYFQKYFNINKFMLGLIFLSRIFEIYAIWIIKNIILIIYRRNYLFTNQR